jgi:hypothetical protein
LTRTRDQITGNGENYIIRNSTNGTLHLPLLKALNKEMIGYAVHTEKTRNAGVKGEILGRLI